MSTVTVRMDSELKREAEHLFAELGLNFSVAVTAFVKAAVRERAIPFELRAEQRRYSDGFLEAVEETRQIMANPSAYPSYSSAAELIAACLTEDADDEV